MLVYLFWRAKAAPDLLLMLVILLAVTTAYSQPGTSLSEKKRITLTVTRQPFHKVIDRLSSITTLNFIYSSNKIPTQSAVSLNVVNSSLQDILNELGSQLNLTFRYQGRYILIKPGTSPVRTTSKQFQDTPVVPPATQKTGQLTDVFLTRPSFYADVRKYLVPTSFSFDTAMLQQLRPHAMSTVRHNRQRWFLSAGMTMNDYSTGAELQFGMRSLYLVVSPAVLGSGQYYGAYGIGTSIPIDSKLSLAPVYTFSNKNQKQFYQELTFGNVLFGERNTQSRHHQFKLLAEYSLSRNIQVRIGPVLNLYASRTRYTANVASARPAGVRVQYYTGNTAYAVVTQAAPAATLVYQTDNDVYTRRWIGWQASISYRINFR